MIPEGFLRRALKMTHEIIEKVTNRHPREFLSGTDYVWYDEITGELMGELALSEDQVDLVMGYLYENVGNTSDAYENMTTIKKPKKQLHDVEVSEVWICRINRQMKVPAYNPLMSQFLVYNDPAKYEVMSDEEWVDHQDTVMTYEGIARN